MNYFLYNNAWNQKNTKNNLDSKFTVKYEAIFYFSKTVSFLVHHIGSTILNFKNLKLDIKSSMIELYHQIMITLVTVMKCPYL